MANTPHMSLRVAVDQLDRWKSHCADEGVDVSHQIRRLMDAWCYSRDLEREAREILEMKPEGVGSPS